MLLWFVNIQRGYKDIDYTIIITVKIDCSMHINYELFCTKKNHYMHIYREKANNKLSHHIFSGCNRDENQSNRQ